MAVDISIAVAIKAGGPVGAASVAQAVYVSWKDSSSSSLFLLSPVHVHDLRLHGLLPLPPEVPPHGQVDGDAGEVRRVGHEERGGDDVPPPASAEAPLGPPLGAEEAHERQQVDGGEAGEGGPQGQQAPPPQAVEVNLRGGGGGDEQLVPIARQQGFATFSFFLSRRAATVPITRGRVHNPCRACLQLSPDKSDPTVETTGGFPTILSLDTTRPTRAPEAGDDKPGPLVEHLRDGGGEERRPEAAVVHGRGQDGGEGHHLEQEEGEHLVEHHREHQQDRTKRKDFFFIKLTSVAIMQHCLFSHVFL